MDYSGQNVGERRARERSDGLSERISAGIPSIVARAHSVVVHGPVYTSVLSLRWILCERVPLYNERERRRTHV